jgi:hypothetical protein
VIRIAEQDFDDFPEVLTEAGGRGTRGWRLTDREIHVDAALASSSDAEALAGRAIRLHGSGVPLERCRLFVVLGVSYAGVGRHAAWEELHAFPETTGIVEVSSFQESRVESGDPAGAGFFRVRLLGKTTGLEVRAGDGAAAIRRVGVDEAEIALTATESSRVLEEHAVIEVVRSGLRRDEIEGDLPEADYPDEIVPRREFGPIRFITRVDARDLGTRAVTAVERLHPEEEAR